MLEGVTIAVDGDDDKLEDRRPLLDMWREQIVAALRPQVDDEDDEGEEGEVEVLGKLDSDMFEDDRDGSDKDLLRQATLTSLRGRGASTETLKVEEDEEPEPTALDWVMHILALPFKFLYAVTVPPAAWLGGIPTFVVSLGQVGLLTAIITDVAGILGCILGIPDPVTAITLVALGTSLPDTFASMIAARSEPTADASITNVTGSNSVNVFMGLGLPWVFSTIYWGGVSPDSATSAQWRARYPDVAAKYPGGPYYVVLGGDLGFSVATFVTACALGTMLILYRRFVLGAELGGPVMAKYASTAILVTLWITYTTLAVLRFTGGI